jgi:hypothetical protein
MLRTSHYSKQTILPDSELFLDVITKRAGAVQSE